MTTRRKVFIGLGAWFGLFIVAFAVLGTAGRNDAFMPQEEFALPPWISLKIGGIDMSINKAVLYLFIAAVLTTAMMIYIANRMELSLIHI